MGDCDSREREEMVEVDLLLPSPTSTPGSLLSMVPKDDTPTGN